MRILVGLGNPGIRYRQTRHNIGFDVVEAVAAHHRTQWQSGKGEYEFAQCSLNDVPFVLAQPLTFMNDSGLAVVDLLEHFHSSIDELLVICDDFQLPLGTLRFRARGSDGGHNGLASVIYHLQRDDFSRLRCGIGSTTMPDAKTLMAEFVLQKFSTDEQPAVQDMVDQAARACDAYVLHGITKTMNVFNQKPLSADDAEPTSN